MQCKLKLIFIITFLYLIGCSNKQNEQIIIIEKDKSNLDKQIEKTNSPNQIEHIILDTSIVDLENQYQTTKPDKIKEDTSLIEKKQVTEFRRAIFSKTMDLNFDRKGDLALIYIIATEKDTISYLSIYIQHQNQMKNTFDIKFDEKIYKINSISTYTDSTIVINAYLKNSKKPILKKFKFINEYNYIPLD